MNPITVIRIVGVVLFAFLFWHLWAMPWALVAAAGLACVVLP